MLIEILFLVGYLLCRKVVISLTRTWRVSFLLDLRANYIGQQSLHNFFSAKPQKRKLETQPSEPSVEPPSLSQEEIHFPSFEDYNLNPDPKPLTHEKFHPIFDAPFKYSQQTPFSFLAIAFDLVENLKGKDSKNMQKIVLSNLYRSIIVLRPDDLVKCVYLCVGKLCPDHLGIEMGIGKETLFKIAARATGLALKGVRREETQTGDLGQVVARGKSTQKNLTSFFAKRSKPAPLTISGVFDTLWKVANFKGQNSGVQKEDELIRLINQASPEEAKYLIRIAQKSLKIGASELTMQSALARALAMTPPKQTGFPPSIVKDPAFEKKTETLEVLLKKSINQCPDYNKLIAVLLECGPDGRPFEYLTETCKITPGTPVKAMLANPTKGIHEVLTRFSDIEFTCEFKYDGMRAQIHVLSDQSIHVYSRNAENITEMYPDLIQLLTNHLDFERIQDCIIDSEVVAFDAATQKIKPFQEIQHRSRKNVSIDAIQVQVCLFVFDIVYLNGESLLELSLADRRDQLFTYIKEIPGKLAYVQHQNVSSFEDIEGLLMESVRIGCEGLMIKTLHSNAAYEPAKRSYNWLKLKKDYISNSETRLSDTVDLVPIGAYFGTGKRKGVYGSYLLAVYDRDNDEYQTICKAGTGFSDEILLELFNTLKEQTVERPPRNYRTLFTDLDVWFHPSSVWEVLGADLSVSPKHTSGWCKVTADKGISLRFPRFIRLRPDKLPTDSTSPEQIAEMYWSQSAVEIDLG